MKKFAVAILVLLVLVISSFMYLKEGSLPANPADTMSRPFIIRKGAALNTIIRDLSAQGLIRDRIVFYLLVRKMGIQNRIQAGEFRLSPAMSAEEVAVNLTKGSLDVWVTLIEGTRKEEMAQVLSRELGIPEVEFVKKAREGYLFPDTYLIPRDATIDQIIAILQANFDRKFSLELQKKAQAKGLTKDEVVILASLVEREARTQKNRQIVASILRRRLEIGMALQIDATVQYAVGYDAASASWWKPNLTRQDLAISSPYNTYRYPGMPPGPIASPSLSSIQAVIDASSTPYLYYISDRTGKTMHYAATLEEHNENIAKYLR
ncbi:MAG: putative aminodeoxychorismate lyase [Microgenomates bacterium OLB22]|nr:MAG: putative aminodeoxychorismate lyase [Microgenomates bacterium OLB22]